MALRYGWQLPGGRSCDSAEAIERRKRQLQDAPTIVPISGYSKPVYDRERRTCICIALGMFDHMVKMLLLKMRLMTLLVVGGALNSGGWCMVVMAGERWWSLSQQQQQQQEEQ